MQFGFETKAGKQNTIPHPWGHLHTHIIGRPNMGQTDLIHGFALDAISHGEGVALFDFHGEAFDLLKRIPPERWDDVCIFAPLDRQYPIGLNPLHNVKRDDQPRVVSAILDTFHALWPSNIFTANIDRYVQATTAALLQAPDETLLGIYYMIESDFYRQRVLRHCKSPVLQQFWEAFDAIPLKDRKKDTESTLSRMFGLILDPMIQNCIGQQRNALEHIIDENKILIVLLPIGHLGIEKVSLIADLVLSQLYFSALERKGHVPYHVLLNDVQLFGSRLVVSMLKNLSDVEITLSHSYIGELDEELRDAIFGLVGTLVAFRLGPTDAAIMEAQFPRDRNRTDLTDLAPDHCNVKMPDRTYSDVTVEPVRHPIYPNAYRELRTRSRQHYASRRADVERRISSIIQRT